MFAIAAMTAASGCGPPESAIPAEARLVRTQDSIQLSLPVCGEGIYELKISFSSGLIRVVGANPPRSTERIIEIRINDDALEELDFANESELEVESSEREGAIGQTNDIVEIGVVADTGYVRFSPNSDLMETGSTHTVVGSEVRPGGKVDSELLADACG